MPPEQTNNPLPHVCDCGTFLLDVVGNYQSENVQVRWSDSARISNDEVNQLIEQAWQSQTKKALKLKSKLFDGSLCRLIECEVDDRQLKLTLGKVSFKEFFGTNLTQAYVRYLHGPEVLANPLGVSAALKTSDGFILLGRRSNRVAYHAGRIHPIGGIMEISATGDIPSPFEAILREISEETNLTGESILETVCLGMVRDKHIVQPELIFDMKVSADLARIRQLSLTATDAEEHTDLIGVLDHPAAIVTFIENHFPELTPLATATLLLHGLRHWGSGWFASARGYLRNVV